MHKPLNRVRTVKCQEAFFLQNHPRNPLTFFFQNILHIIASRSVIEVSKNLSRNLSSRPCIRSPDGRRLIFPRVLPQPSLVHFAQSCSSCGLSHSTRIFMTPSRSKPGLIEFVVHPDADT